MTSRREFFGELFGTFLLVFFGLSAVVAADILGAHMGLFQVAAIWGLGLMVAIFVSAESSGAHLNPAITLAFATWSGFPWKKVLGYVLAQCTGAFLAALMIFAVFGGAFKEFDRLERIEAFMKLDSESGSWSSLRNDENTGEVDGGKEYQVRTAMAFGEFYPNPAMSEGGKLDWVGTPEAFLAEALGTAVLAFTIFALVGQKRESIPSWLVPIGIGLVLVVLISILAPISQGGFNPARDLMPRIASSFLGWGSVPFTYNGWGWLIVYVIAPIFGAQIGAFASRYICEKELD